MNKLLVITLLGVFAFTAIQASLLDAKADLFVQWKKVNLKEYATVEEEQYRFEIWSDTFDWVQIHNQVPEHTYKVHTGPFADLTNTEYQALIDCNMPVVINENTNQNTPMPVQDGEYPASIDWR